MREKLEGDKDQALLGQYVALPNPRKYASRSEGLPNPNKKVTCPFCLGMSPFRLFLTSTKHGISRSLGKCPLCHLGMRLRTLASMDSWGPKDYASFVAPYAADGFWKKINFDTWKKRLSLMGWTEEFWDQYHEIRPPKEE